MPVRIRRVIMVAIKSPADLPEGSLETAVIALADKGLAQYLADADLADEIVTWLADELKVSKVFLRPGVKVLATLVAGVAQEGTSWLGKVGVDHLKYILSGLPYYERLTTSLGLLLSRFDQQIAAERQFKDILSGRRPSRDADFTDALALDLQADIRVLQRLSEHSQAVTEDIRGLAEGIGRVETHLNPQPPLALRFFEQTRQNRFHYTAQLVPFFGREKELSALDSFLRSDTRFSWWLLTGAGGQGKSRLALELCLRHGMAWRTGFLLDEPFAWIMWQPERPTLMVVDYAASRAESLRKTILALYDRRHQFDFPVRLLLIEREGPKSSSNHLGHSAYLELKPTWFAGFLGSGSDQHAICASSHDPDPMVLGCLDEESLKQLMSSVFAQAGETRPPLEHAFYRLMAIDPEAKPLFGMFVAETLAAGLTTQHHSQIELLRDVLAREVDRYWKPAGVTEQDCHLIALATMIGGLPVEQLPIVDAGDLLPTELTFSPSRYQAITGRLATETISPLEPDLLGELFVLDLFNPRHDADRARSKILRAIAWQEAPFGMSAFLSRTAKDFPKHNALKTLVLEPVTETPDKRDLWSMTAADVISDIYNLEDSGFVKDLFLAISDLSQNYPDETRLVEWRQRGLLNLLTSIIEHKQDFPLDPDIKNICFEELFRANWIPQEKGSMWAALQKVQDPEWPPHSIQISEAWDRWIGVEKALAEIVTDILRSARK